MKCIIVEDNTIALKITQQMVSRAGGLELLESFQDPVQALNYLNEQSVDLVFLDIEMPEISGLELLLLLKDKSPMIILTTSHSDYALDSYNYGVVDFLVKPLDFARFMNAVSKARNQFERKKDEATPEEDILYIKKGGSIVRVSKADILWIESLGDYVTIHTEKENFVVHTTMNAMEQKFSSQVFMRVHRSYIIRFDKIKNIEDNCIAFPDKLIPIGKTYKEAVFKRLNIL